MWVLHQLDPQGAAYNLSVALRLEGRIDRPALAAALREVVRRHESLRTAYVVEERGEVRQRIAAAEQVALPSIALVDLSRLPAERRAAELERLARREAQVPFELASGRPWRSRLVRLASEEHVWLFEAHHIAADGWSLAVLVRELEAGYAAALAGGKAAAAEVAVQAADHAVWQRGPARGEALARQVEYWRAALQGAPPVLELPTDRPRQAAALGRGDRVAVRLPGELVAALERVGRREGATRFMVLLAGFQLLLARLGRQDDVVVGVPVAGRGRAELRDAIGLFVNTLPMRARLARGMTVAELVQQVRATVLAGLAHQEAPFEQIVASLVGAGPPDGRSEGRAAAGGDARHAGAIGRGDAGRAPLLHALFAMQNLPVPRWRAGGLVGQVRELPAPGAKLDLELTLWEGEVVGGGSGGELHGWLEYDASRFERGSVERMAAQLETLLRAMAADGSSSTPVHALELDDAAGRAELASWNASEEELGWSGCVHELFAAQVRRSPAAIALRFEGRQLAYAELGRRAEALARRLARAGVGEAPVVVLIDRSVELVVALLGTLSAGAAYLPLDAEAPVARSRFAVAEARAQVVLTSRALAARAAELAAGGARVIVLDEEGRVIGAPSGGDVEPAAGGAEAAGRGGLAERSGGQASRLAYVLYTSGSTGLPKGVENEHRGLVNRLAWHQRQFPLAPGDRVLHKTPTTFDVSVWELFWPLLVGATLVVARPGGHADPRYLRELLVAERITCVHFVPSMLRAFLEELEGAEGAGGESLRWVLCSGEALTPELVALAQARLWRGAELHNLYGPTEAAIDVTHWRCARGDGAAAVGVVPIGRPVANTQIHIVDEALRPVPRGAVGELCIGGVQVARGYLRRPGLTAERFVADPFAPRAGARMYRTGDLARHRGDGSIEFLGRLDHQVKLRGFRIELGEIEAALVADERVQQAAALVREDRPGDQRLVGYVVMRGGAAWDAAALRRGLAARLPAYMVPGELVELSALPLTSSGKLDRKALPAPRDDGEAAAGGEPGQARGARGASSTAAAPRSALEAAMVWIWAEVLGVTEVGVGDHFFERGGHSLLATRVVARVRRELRVEVPLRAVFEAPTPAAFAERVAAELTRRRRGRGAVELSARQGGDGGSDDVANDAANDAANEEGRRRGAADDVELGELGEAIPALARSADGTLKAPLSFAQERLWFLQRLEPESPAYHMPAAIEISGPLDVQALTSSLRAIVRRHEALRTTFVCDEAGRVWQRVAGASDAAASSEEETRISVEDLREWAGAAQEAEVTRRARAEARGGFDLERGPLLRTKLLRTGEERHVWLVTLHHIVADEWSVGVLVRELTELYAAEVERRAARLGELGVQYADYAAWQRRALQGEALERELRYWREALEGIPDGLDLAADHARPAVASYRGGTVGVRVRAEVVRGVEAVARAEGATLFMGLLAGYQVLLSRWAGQEEVVVGTPVANRTRAEVEGVIGFFVNTLALRGRVRGGMTVRELVRAAKEAALGGYAHQAVPFERVVEELGVRRDLGRMPVVQVLLTLQNAPEGALRLAGMELREREVGTETAKVDVDVTLRKVGSGELEGTLEYNADLFEEETARGMARRLEQILEGMARGAERVGELGWVSAAEREELIERRNETGRDFGAERAEWAGAETYRELFGRQAVRSPDAVAVECEGRAVTYGELARQARRIGRGVRAAGCGREDVVAVLGERDEEYVAAVVGVLEGSAVYMPLDPAWPQERMETVGRQAGAKLVLALRGYEAQGRQLAERLGVAVREVAELLATREATTTTREGSDDDARGARDASGDMEAQGIGEAREPLDDGADLGVGGTAMDLAYVLFTSGSTGTPKGVMVPQGAMLNQQLAKLVELELGEGDAIAQTARQSFDISVWQMVALLLVGGRVVVVRGERAWVPEQLLEELSAKRVSVVETVPSHLGRLLDEVEARGERYDLSGLRWVMPTGEALGVEVCRRWFAAMPGVPLVNAYGPAECADDTSLCVLRKAPEGGYAGIEGTVANVRYYVVDEELRAVPEGICGELCIGGAGPGRGYIGEPGRTAEAFVADPFAREAGARMYRTGDVVRYRRGGGLEYVGRRDHQVKLRGFRIELGEIEAALAEQAGVAEAVAVVRREGERAASAEGQLVAYVVGRGGYALDEEALRTAAAARLPSYMVPSAIAVLAELPRTASGKVDRKALPAPRLAGASAEERSLAERRAASLRTPAEQLLGGIWRQLLGLEEVERLDDFFARGGHSLLAIQVASRLGQALGVRVPVRAIFEHPVLAELAEVAAGGERRQARPPIAPAPRRGLLPLSFSQEQLWMAQALAPASGAYNMSAGLRLRGPLQLEVLRRALGELVARHEILRMRVARHDGRPHLAIEPALALELPLDDLRAVATGAARQAELARRFEAHASAPFELERAPLYRVAGWRLDDDEVVLALTLHHITCDGWSINLLAEELAALYAAFVDGRPSPLPPLALQYGDVAAWQRRWMTGEVLAEHLAHFTRRLGGELPVLALPLDRPRAQRRGDAGASLLQPLDAELGRAVDELGQALGATFHMTLLAAFLVLLYRHGRQEDLILGTTVAGRAQPETEPLIGCFINNLALRFDLSARPSFRELVAQVRRETLAAYDYQALPFELLLDAVAPPRQPGVSPIFQAVFGVQPGELSVPSLPGLDVAWLRPPSEAARYDLTVWIERGAGGLRVEWTYSAELFDAATIEELARGYEEILRRAVADPELGLSALALAATPAAGPGRQERAGGERDDEARKRALGDSLRRIKRRPRADEAG